MLIFIGQEDVFKWLLALSFLTDAVDGYFARKFGVVSVMGSRIDSIADDLTVLVALVGLWMWKREFFVGQYLWIFIVGGLFLIQLLLAWIRYGKPTSFHTYLAKTAAVFQGVFLILCFFQPYPLPILFYSTLLITALDILEEIIMVILLPKWQSDIKSLYHLLTQKYHSI
ncbi:hypothetical protein GCM10023231_25200 [Olivibacter ginsenosidimutans]|uniref:CDP-alcohol phosphatidyltransferase family protein n=2 Tax=Olivibacter ginsenosidimutans TaxID=1176537 RepID=A0ABP9BLF2_9SPHI